MENRILHHCCVRGQSQLLCSHALVKFNIHLHVRRTANFHRPLTSLPLFCCAGCFLPILLLPKARQLHHQSSQTVTDPTHISGIWMWGSHHSQHLLDSQWSEAQGASIPITIGGKRDTFILMADSCLLTVHMCNICQAEGPACVPKG